MHVEPSSVRQQRREVLSCDGHVVDMPPVPEEARGGQEEAGRDARWIAYPRQPPHLSSPAEGGEQINGSFII